MKVLFMGKPGNLSPWYEDFGAALGDDFVLELWDRDRPFGEQIAGAIAVADAGAALDATMIEQAAHAGVRLWQMISAGYDHLDLATFRANAIRVANTPGPFSAHALAEHALLLMLCITKEFACSQRHLAEGRFYRAFGEELGEHTLGLVGLGASARELAKIAAALDMRIIGIDPEPPADEVVAALGIEVLGGPEKLPALLARSDYVSMHVPLTPQTRGMMTRESFATMKPSAVFINVSRGGVVDQAALVDALRDRQIRAAGLDVFEVEPLPADDPLRTLDNVVLTPHTAGSTYPTSRRRGRAAADNIRRVADGEAPLYTVDGADPLGGVNA